MIEKYYKVIETLENNDTRLFYINDIKNGKIGDYGYIYSFNKAILYPYVNKNFKDAIIGLVAKKFPKTNTNSKFHFDEVEFKELPSGIKDAFLNPKFKPDWEQRRFDCAMNFMANMLNSDETFRAKIVSDLLYKEVAAFSVKCADALIEELKK